MLEKVKVYGRLSDFEDNSLHKGDIFLLDNNFNIVNKAKTDETGHYEMMVEKGRYMGLAGVKDYAESNLEFWAWHVPVFNDLEINMRNDSLEVYALNAFMPQGGYPQIMLYFRPMSLKRYKIKQKNELKEIYIAPELQVDDIEVTINDKTATILELSEVIEAAGEESMKAYLVSLAKPELNADYNVIHIVLNDRELDEKGEAILFWKPNQF